MVSIEERRAQRLRWYYANREHQLRGDRARHARIRTEIRNTIIDYLATHPCVDCGESDPVVLDFDHIAGKSFNIAKASWMLVSVERLLAEINKCEVRCSNCHRRRTARVQGHRDKRRT
jgi:5-methylcytosine-specific restriction endonuclease McrA